MIIWFMTEVKCNHINDIKIDMKENYLTIFKAKVICASVEREYTAAGKC